MELITHLFKLAAGVGLFLFAMYLLEESLKNLSGRRFKLFLQKATKNRIAAAAGGAVVTAILQSSSMVSLMVLAFVGAGVFTMRNAMAVILGANLGTTLDSWLVATLGFNMDIEWIAYPAICIGGALMIIFGSRKTFKYVSYFLFGFGLLFIGLSFMKTAMEEQVQTFDFAQYADLPLIGFLLIGFLITLLVQSSSVTMALTLSALHAGAIGFAPAAAIVLGAETGTNIKILLSGIGGNATKKRVSLGNFLFNVFMTIVAFILLRPILLLITDVFKVTDPLLGLVTFSTFINLAGISIFLPLLDPFSRLLERFFQNTNASAAAFIDQANVAEPESAWHLLRKETAFFIHNAMRFNLSHFEIDATFLETDAEFTAINAAKKIDAKSQDDRYVFIKQLQGELQAFYLKLRSKSEDWEHAAALNQLISAVRSAMYATKCINDISQNIDDLINSPQDFKFKFFAEHKAETETLYRQLAALLQAPETANYEAMKRIYAAIEENYTTSLDAFYKNAATSHLENIDITVITNFNRELLTANKAMLMAVKEFLLDDKDAAEFNELLVYKT